MISGLNSSYALANGNLNTLKKAIDSEEAMMNGLLNGMQNANLQTNQSANQNTSTQASNQNQSNGQNGRLLDVMA